MTHQDGRTLYELLGVAADATPGELRAAYVARARAAHPDVVGDRPSSSADIRDINHAWTVLSDPAARERYDLTLPMPGGGSARAGDGGPGGGPGGRGAAPTGPQPSTLRRPSSEFTPYHEIDEDDDDSWRYADDATDPETAPSVGLQLLPIVLVALGIAAVVVGGFVRLELVMALGGILVVLGLVSFLVVPMIVMGRAGTVERRREQGRVAGR